VINQSKREPFDCPVCGEEVPAGASACPQCGACENTGWNDDTRYDGLDLPEEAFDEDDPPTQAPRQPPFPLGKWLIAAVAALLIIVLLRNWLGL
jgi:hypothetical protein